MMKGTLLRVATQLRSYTNRVIEVRQACPLLFSTASQSPSRQQIKQDDQPRLTFERRGRSVHAATVSAS
jgi:hypothetical protein